MESILSVVGGIARFVAIFGGVLAAVFIAWAGIQWMTAAGDPQRMSQVRMSLIGTVVGLIIVGVAFLIPLVVSEMVIEPAGGIPVKLNSGFDCDGLLKRQLVSRTTASDPQRMQWLVQRIQAQREQCAPEFWSPALWTENSVPTVCFDTGVTPLTVGGMMLPKSFQTDDQVALPASSRDARNNIIVYWDYYPLVPSDGSSCWLYISAFNAWGSGGGGGGGGLAASEGD